MAPLNFPTLSAQVECTAPRAHHVQVLAARAISLLVHWSKRCLGLRNLTTVLNLFFDSFLDCPPRPHPTRSRAPHGRTVSDTLGASPRPNGVSGKEKGPQMCGQRIQGFSPRFLVPVLPIQSNPPGPLRSPRPDRPPPRTPGDTDNSRPGNLTFLRPTRAPLLSNAGRGGVCVWGLIPLPSSRTAAK